MRIYAYAFLFFYIRLINDIIYLLLSFSLLSFLSFFYFLIIYFIFSIQEYGEECVKNYEQKIDNNTSNIDNSNIRKTIIEQINKAKIKFKEVQRSRKKSNLNNSNSNKTSKKVKQIDEEKEQEQEKTRDKENEKSQKKANTIFETSFEQQNNNKSTIQSHKTALYKHKKDYESALAAESKCLEPPHQQHCLEPSYQQHCKTFSNFSNLMNPKCKSNKKHQLKSIETSKEKSESKSVRNKKIRERIVERLKTKNNLNNKEHSIALNKNSNQIFVATATESKNNLAKASARVDQQITTLQNSSGHNNIYLITNKKYDVLKNQYDIIKSYENTKKFRELVIVSKNNSSKFTSNTKYPLIFNHITGVSYTKYYTNKINNK